MIKISTVICENNSVTYGNTLKRLPKNSGKNCVKGQVKFYENNIAIVVEVPQELNKDESINYGVNRKFTFPAYDM